MSNINKSRRQQFLYPELYQSIISDFEAAEAIESPSFAINDLRRVAGYGSDFDNALDALMLEYTAGTPIEQVKAMFPAVVEAFEKWCEAKVDWQFAEFPEDRGKVLPTPVELDDLGSYQQMMRFFSLGVLFNEGALLQRAYATLGPWRGHDTVVEALVEDYVENPCEEAEGLCHFDLYDDLISAAWAETAEDSANHMQTFLKSWYKAYRGQPWHDAHLRVGDIPENPHWANYYGYWAFEAGALSYLYELDDTPWRDHLLYPKNLVDWARQQGRPVKLATPETKAEILTALPGQPCPESGEWFAHQLGDRKVFVEKGQPMPGPEFSATGQVIWHLRQEG